MDKIHELAFRTIQIRSQILESLYLYASEYHPIDTMENLFRLGERSSDVIEHISQYALEGVSHDMQATCLIQDLNAALLIISEFDKELKMVRGNIPTACDINQIINELNNFFQIKK